MTGVEGERHAAVASYTNRTALTHGWSQTRLLSSVLLLAALLIAPLAAGSQRAAAQGPNLAIDARPTGNQPTELGPVDSCVSADPGAPVQIDIVIQDVQELLAWELYLAYDAAVVEVEEIDVRLFQEANTGSSVFNVSDRLPDSDGLYRLAAADTSDPPSPDSGSGVLARLTLRTVSPGRSDLTLPSRDLDGDEEPDLGPFLRNGAGDVIGDSNDDTFFDGPITGAEIRVGQSCPGQPADGGQNGSSGQGIGDGGVSTAVIVGAVVGGIAFLAAVGGLSAFFLRHRVRA